MEECVGREEEEEEEEEVEEEEEEEEKGKAFITGNFFVKAICLK